MNQNLFLVCPPHKKIIASVSLKEIQPFLSSSEIDNIREKSQTQNLLKCIAITKWYRTEYDAMGEGDIVLMTQSNTLNFEYYGEVLYKTENEALGNYLWKPTNKRLQRPPFIYFLKNLKRLNMDKPRFLCELGCEKYFWRQITRVSELRLTTILQRYASIKEFIESMSIYLYYNG